MRRWCGEDTDRRAVCASPKHHITASIPHHSASLGKALCSGGWLAALCGLSIQIAMPSVAPTGVT